MAKPYNSKVLFVITKSNWGGAQKYVYELATNLPDTYEPVVALGGTGAEGAQPGLLKTRLDAVGVRTCVIPHFMRNMSLADDIYAFFELWNIVRTERPSVLHVTSSKAGGLGALIGRLARVPHIVFTSHGLTFDETWRPNWQRALIRLFTWVTIVLSTRTIQISSDTYHRARSMLFCKNKVVLVRNGIETPSFMPHAEARKALLPNAAENTYVEPWIGTIAEYHPNKNLDVLVQSVASLKEQGLKTHLILIGEEGDGRAHLEAIAQQHAVEDRVHLLGAVPGAAQYLTALDVFALPSKKEGLPYVLLEAGLAKLPVVVSNITGNTEIVTHERTGLVVDATPNEITETFDTLLANQALREQYGKALHDDVTHQFSIETMIQNTLATYR